MTHLPVWTVSSCVEFEEKQAIVELEEVYDHQTSQEEPNVRQLHVCMGGNNLNMHAGAEKYFTHMHHIIIYTVTMLMCKIQIVWNQV